MTSKNPNAIIEQSPRHVEAFYRGNSVFLWISDTEILYDEQYWKAHAKAYVKAEQVLDRLIKNDTKA